MDDSIGEAFDKVANMLGLGYPGGPIVEELAAQGDEDRFDFPIAMRNSKDLNFSYSGLKTAVLRVVKDLGNEQESTFAKTQNQSSNSPPTSEEAYKPSLSKKSTYKLKKQDIVDVAASFQKAACLQLECKITKAIDKFKVCNVLLGGGVVANKYIRKRLRKLLKERKVVLVHPQNKKLISDNAGMIVIAAYYSTLAKRFIGIENLDRIPKLSL
jgi:N6-L-threonylcarbamoyladenine synthase